MKRYQERGGWILFIAAGLYAYLAYSTEYLWQGIVFAIMAAVFAILNKLERISNALSDMHNGEDNETGNPN